MKNPFRPGFGMSPLYLAGRDQLLRDFTFAFAEGIGAPLRVSLISGPRGSGKTVMLNEVENIAKAQGWIVVRANPRTGMVQDLIDPTIRRALEGLDSSHRGAQRKIVGGSIAGMSITTAVQERGSARKTLITELRALTQVAEEHDAGVLITIDEIQAVDVDEMAELAVAIQDLIRDEMNIAFLAAGLPEGVNELLQHDGTTFLRRAEHLPLSAVCDDDVAEAITKTIEDAGRTIAKNAVDLCVQLVRGYPYLIQLVGSLTWAAATIDNSASIKKKHVEDIEGDVVRRMAHNIHDPALRAVTDSQRSFLHAMAEIMGRQEAGRVRSSDIAAKLGVAASSISMRRKALIDAGIIQSPAYGELSFSIPYLAETLLSE